MGSGVDLHRTVRDRLAGRDQRYTTGRRRLVETLVGAAVPLTLPDLLERSPGLAQSSAYRNLSVLEEAGVVRRLVHGNDHAHYELAEDLTEHHHHLVCERCGLVRDITLDASLERALDAAFAGAAEEAGFQVRHHAIDLYGWCADCRAAAGTG
jgi:Fe2+ or Zn2+ uptake regulation protein